MGNPLFFSNNSINYIPEIFFSKWKTLVKNNTASILSNFLEICIYFYYNPTRNYLDIFKYISLIYC